MPRLEVTIVHKPLPEPVRTAYILQPHQTAPLELATSKRSPAVPAKPREQALRTLSDEASFSAPEMPDLTYYGTRQLDVYPTLSAALDIRYTDSAAAAGITGHALILVLIDAAGTVDDVKVVEADPAGYFENDVRQAFMAARFTPAVRNGRSVRSRLLVRVSYGGELAAR
jgi:protein TonB